MTLASEFITATHCPVPMQLELPDQPPNANPAAGIGVRVTLVPEAKVAEQLVPQLIPDGELEMVPALPFELATDNVNCCGGGAGPNVAVTF